MSIKNLVELIKRNGLLTSMHQLEELYKLAIENEEMLAESQREFRAADATIENLQMQVEKLAAENAGLKNAITAVSKTSEECEINGDELKYVVEPSEFEALTDLLDETPATDAFLAEVRAQGVEMFAKETSESDQGNGLMKAIGRRAYKFAAQLRQGVI